jgi:hypothetical protein
MKYNMDEMKLLDTFAAAVLQGQATRGILPGAAREEIADRAYGMAEIMLAKRKEVLYGQT